MPDQRQLFFERLAGVDRELRTAIALLEFAEQAQRDDPACLNDWGLGTAAVSALRDNLDATYQVRLFSEFEGCLFEFWTQSMLKTQSRTARQLIEAIGSRCRMSQTILDGAQEARMARNEIVHLKERETAAAPPIHFGNAKRRLNRFISSLPRQW